MIGYIPANVLKANIEICLKDLATLVNDCLEKAIFPDELKFADVSPFFKKGQNLEKENYRLFSILSQTSKVFERIYKQINNFITSNFPPFLCGL